MPTIRPSAFPPFVYWKFTCRSAPCPSSLHLCASSSSVPLLCVSFQFLVYCSVFFVGVFQSAQGVMLAYPRVSWGNIAWRLVLTCWSAKMSPSRFGASVWWCSSPPVSQSNVVWRSFPWSRGSGYQSFDSSCCFISANVAPASHQGFGVLELTLSVSAPKSPSSRKFWVHWMIATITLWGGIPYKLNTIIHSTDTWNAAGQQFLYNIYPRHPASVGIENGWYQ
jgi:hypothetical protein